MKLDANIDLFEVNAILRASLAKKFNQEIGDVAITSYGKPKMIFHEDGLVVSVEMRHRIVVPARQPAPTAPIAESAPAAAYLSFDQAARFCRLSRASLEIALRDRKAKFPRPFQPYGAGGRRSFKQQELVAWIERKRATYPKKGA